MKRRASFVGVSIGIMIASPAWIAWAAPKSPVLTQFDARFDQSQTTTFYIATAYDPGGSKLAYHWSLSARCGYLIDPNGTTPSNGYQFGPPASKPSGCSRDQEQSAMLSVRIVNSAGCAIVYSQAARDETQHVHPTVRAEPCPPDRGIGGSAPLANARSFPTAAIAGALLAIGGAFALVRLRAHARAQSRVSRSREPIRDEEEDMWAATDFRAEEEVAPSARVVRDEPKPLDLTDVLAIEDPDDHEVDEDEWAEPAVIGAPCEDGAVRAAGNDYVAHETVLAGNVRASVPDGRLVEIPSAQPRDVLVLASLLEDGAPLEVEVEIPLRLVTIVCSRREICSDGRWKLDVQSQTHDGPQRVERLRAIVTSAEDLERFADQILAKRLRSLLDARRRLESTLAGLNARPIDSLDLG